MNAETTKTIRAYWFFGATLRDFACKQALSVIHLWDAPPVVREYLETRDESKRDAAWDAAWAAAWAAARDTAWAAAWDAARKQFREAVDARFAAMRVV